MTKSECLHILKSFQLWRRGAEMPQPRPADLSEALEMAIKIVQKARTK